MKMARQLGGLAVCRTNSSYVSSGQESERGKPEAPWLANGNSSSSGNVTLHTLVKFQPESGETRIVQPRACATQNGVPQGRAATSLVGR